MVTLAEIIMSTKKIMIIFSIQRFRMFDRLIAILTSVCIAQIIMILKMARFDRDDCNEIAPALTLMNRSKSLGPSNLIPDYMFQESLISLSK